MGNEIEWKILKIDYSIRLSSESNRWYNVIPLNQNSDTHVKFSFPL